MNKKSGHWQNTGLAKWISDNLYQYNTSDEKSMNPMKWYSIQNGGNLSDTRETINGFPCRLILINDGETPLNEGQNEPTPGNVKDMGIFNFNNDKGNTDTFGLDNSIFPRCVSYEVVANSDTSAGAFVPYKTFEYNIGHIKEGHTTLIPTSLFNGKLVFHKYHENTPKVGYFQYSQSGDIIKYNELANFEEEILIENNAKYVRFIYSDIIVSGTKTYKVNEYTFYDTLGVFTNLNNSDTPICEPIISEEAELAYLQDSFELRYPDDKEVGADYGMLGMDIDNSGTLNSEYGLKRVIDWVGNATNEEFVANFEQYFNKEYTFRYYLLVITLGMVDNLGGRSC